MSEPENAEQIERSGAARLFDVRRVIGWLFVVYGVVVTGAGVLDGPEATAKAGGIDINLWSGLGMLALGVVFLAWLRLRPLGIGEGDDPAESDQSAESTGTGETGEGVHEPR